MRTDEVLDRAADKIQFEGRTIGVAYDHTGRGCLVETLARIEDESSWLDSAPRSPTYWTHYVERSPEALLVLYRYLRDHRELVPERVAVFINLVDGGVAPVHQRQMVEGDVVVMWNDRTTDDGLVIETLRRCAKELREQAGAEA